MYVGMMVKEAEDFFEKWGESGEVRSVQARPYTLKAAWFQKINLVKIKLAFNLNLVL